MKISQTVIEQMKTGAKVVTGVTFVMAVGCAAHSVGSQGAEMSPASEPATCEVVEPTKNQVNNSETQNENEASASTEPTDVETLTEHDPDYCPPCGRG